MANWKTRAYRYTDTFGVLVGRWEDAFEEAREISEDPSWAFNPTEIREFVGQEVGGFENLVDTWAAARVSVVERLAHEKAYSRISLDSDTRSLGRDYRTIHERSKQLSDETEALGVNPFKDYLSHPAIQELEDATWRHQYIDLLDSLEPYEDPENYGNLPMKTEDFIDRYRDDNL